MPQAKAKPQAQFDAESAIVALHRRNLTITKLADDLDRPRTSVSRAIRHGVFPKLRTLIATRLGLS